MTREEFYLMNKNIAKDLKKKEKELEGELESIREDIKHYTDKNLMDIEYDILKEIGFMDDVELKEEFKE